MINGLASNTSIFAALMDHNVAAVMRPMWMKRGLEIEVTHEFENENPIGILYYHHGNTVTPTMKYIMGE